MSTHRPRRPHRWAVRRLSRVGDCHRTGIVRTGEADDRAADEVGGSVDAEAAEQGWWRTDACAGNDWADLIEEFSETFVARSALGRDEWEADEQAHNIVVTMAASIGGAIDPRLFEARDDWEHRVRGVTHGAFNYPPSDRPRRQNAGNLGPRYPAALSANVHRPRAFWTRPSFAHAAAGGAIAATVVDDRVEDLDADSLCLVMIAAVLGLSCCFRGSFAAG